MISLNDYMPPDLADVNGLKISSWHLASFYDLFVQAHELHSALVRLREEAYTADRDGTRPHLLASQKDVKEDTPHLLSARSAISLLCTVAEEISVYIAEQQALKIPNEVWILFQHCVDSLASGTAHKAVNHLFTNVSPPQRGRLRPKLLFGVSNNLRPVG